MSEKDNAFESVPIPEIDGLKLTPEEVANHTETIPNQKFLTINHDNDSIKSRRKDVLTRLLNDLLKKLEKEEEMTDEDVDRYMDWVAHGFGKVSYSYVLQRELLCVMRSKRKLLALDVTMSMSLILYANYIDFESRMHFLKKLTSNMANLTYEI